MCAMTHPLYLLQTKHSKRHTSDNDFTTARHFWRRFGCYAPIRWTPRRKASIYTQTLLITANSRLQKALAHHSVEIGLPKHYAPTHLVPEGKMHILKKILSKQAVLIVKFILPSSLKFYRYNCSAPTYIQRLCKCKVPTWASWQLLK